MQFARALVTTCRVYSRSSKGSYRLVPLAVLFGATNAVSAIISAGARIALEWLT